jgi:ferric-dicitrate binding protein FerR (iron transport regulator)
MQEDAKLQPLIEKYLAGQATPEEEQELQQWFEQLHTPPEAGYTVPDEEERAALGARIYATVENNIQAYEALQPVKMAPMSRTRRVWWRIAAAVIPAAIVTAGGLLYKSKTQHALPEAKVLDLYTHEGELSKVVLTDSSVVWLNANSHLRYPEKFSTGNRTVHLEGEAYFEIQQDPQHPFIIESNGYRTRVLGTTFCIRSYSTPNVYKVTVASGKVVVYKSQDSANAVFLTANQELRIAGANGTPEVRSVHAMARIAWKEGRLSFEKDPLAEVAASLQNRYGTKFRFSQPALEKIEISGTFDYNQSLDDILKILSKVYNLHFKKQTDGIIHIS